MTLPSRRGVLAATAAALGTVAGCLSDDEPADTSTDAPPRTDTDETSTTDETGTVTFRTPDGGLVPDAQITVLPPALGDMLRRAARTGATVRGYDDRFVTPPPNPFLRGTETLALDVPDDEALSGVYTFEVASGPRYEMRAGVAGVETVPAEETATPVADLGPARRQFVEQAVAGQQPSVYPETELGTWFRESFVRGYFRVDGRTYRGREIQQTDAGFFSETIWYVFEPSDGSADEPPSTLSLPDLPPSLLARLESLLPPESGGPTTVEDPSDAMAALASETTFVATHTGIFRITLD
ncbi:hypothetical protein [Haloarchaeobius sp. DT45]|uniref:hypothetical protein n=1 Tax=Haloarchaeobius sp. DT45 TaxID=3446116 RepID=UPI003F6B3ACA